MTEHGEVGLGKEALFKLWFEQPEGAHHGNDQGKYSPSKGNMYKASKLDLLERQKENLCDQSLVGVGK